MTDTDLKDLKALLEESNAKITQMHEDIYTPIYIEDPDHPDQGLLKDIWNAIKNIVKGVGQIGTDIKTALNNLKELLGQFWPHVPEGYEALVETVGRIDTLLVEAVHMMSPARNATVDLARADDAFTRLGAGMDAFLDRHGLPPENPMHQFLGHWANVGTQSKTLLLGLSPEMVNKVEAANEMLDGLHMSTSRDGPTSDQGKREGAILFFIALGGYFSVAKDVFPLTVSGQAEGGVSAVAEAEAGLVVAMCSPTGLLGSVTNLCNVIAKALEFDLSRQAA